MRKTPLRLAGMAALALVSTLNAHASVAATRSLKSACAAATRAVREALADDTSARETILMTAGAPSLIDPVLDRASGDIAAKIIGRDALFWRSGWEGRRPSQALVRRWYGKRGAPPTSCADEHVFSSVSGESVDTQAESVRVLLRVSFPVLSDDGKDALTWLSLEGPSLQGRNWLMLLHCRGGTWVKVGARGILVS